MSQLGFRSGLMVPAYPALDDAQDVEDIITDEAGLRPPHGTAPRVSMVVEDGAFVAQGAPVACHSTQTDICFVAPMPGRVARTELLSGHRLSEIVLFREGGGDSITHDTTDAQTEAGLRRLMQRAGFWPRIGRRPFGGMPNAAERPAAIFILAADTRPHAPDPRRALEGHEDAFRRGCRALSRLTEGPVLLCQAPGPALADKDDAPRLQVVITGPRHPQASAGLLVHAEYPAGIATPVWDVNAEDVAALGDLLHTGALPQTRLVHVGGSALKTGRMVRTQIGADLRALTFRHVRPGPHRLWSGSSLDGHAARWLAPRHRQVTAFTPQAPDGAPHWLVAALTRSARPKPMIPTAALDQAFAGRLPAAVFLRALSAGDDETALKMGVLSLLEEDVALADYVLGAEAHLAVLLRGMLERIKTEFAA